VLIRKYRDSDREAIEYIHFETGFLGKSMSQFLSNNKLWKKSIKKYLKKHKEHIFVLEDKKDKKVKGYIFGCINDKNESLVVESFILAGTLFSGIFTKKKDRQFWNSHFKYILNILSGKSGELKYLKTPDGAGHIHINLLPEARGKKWGTKLLRTFEKHAKSKGTKEIYANSFKTELNKNTNFWLKNGFKQYSETNSNHWKKQLPNEKIRLVCYSKKL
jgi:GNAT superfamily N-acetyltransferase